MSKDFLLSGIPAKWVDDLAYFSSQSSISTLKKGLGQAAARLISAFVFPLFAAVDWVCRRGESLYERSCVILSKDEISKNQHREEVRRCDDLARRSFLGMSCFIFGLISPDIVTQHFVPNPKIAGQVAPYGKLYSAMAQEVFPTTVEEVQEIVREAQKKEKKVSIAGASMSQGKQILPPGDGNIVINMKNIKSISINCAQKIATVGGGVTWEQLQREANQNGLAIQVMQASNVFSVGGSLSANCHGWDHKAGSLANTVRAVTVINPHGQLLRLEPKDDLFKYVVGGWGGFGVIVQVELNLIENAQLRERGEEVAPANYVNYFRNKVCTNDDTAMHLYRLSLDPDHLFETGVAVSWDKKGTGMGCSTLIDEPERGNRMDRVGLHLVRRSPSILSYAWEREKNAALTERTTTRNEVMRPPIKSVINHSRVDSEWLQEYFVKGEDLDAFLKFLGQTLKENNVPVFNASVRFVKKDERAAMGYAKSSDMFAIVLFFNQSLLPEKVEQTKKWVQKVIDYITPRGGTFYLPYPHFASQQQFQASYPQWQEIVKKKDEFDPQRVFTNGLYEDYLPSSLSQRKVTVAGIEDNPLNRCLQDMWDRREELAKNPFFAGSYVAKMIADFGAKHVEAMKAAEARPVSTYRDVFNKEGGQRGEFRDFLKNVFMQLDEDKFFTLIDSILEDKDLTNEQIYDALSKRIGEARNGVVQHGLSILRSLRELNKDLSGQVQQVMGKDAKVNGYVEIGYPGRLIRPIRSRLDMSGPMIVLHDKQRPTDVIEAGIIRPYNKFVPLNNFDPIDEAQIPSASVDMVTCFIGLHHTPPEKLAAFVQSLKRILRPGGSFVLMDHDAKTEKLQRLVDVVHSVFNAATGVSAKDEKEEIRHFNSLQHWIDLLKSEGFNLEPGEPLMRAGDSTLNSVIRFTKTPVGEAEIAAVAERTSGYHRDQLQTYLTMPEWHNVRVSQAYAKFIEHTPFYQFPYFKEIKEFWKVFANSWNAAREHNTFSEVAFSGHTLMNLFIGISMTIEFFVKGLMSAPIAKMYGSEALKEPEVLQLLVRHQGSFADKRVKVVKEFPGLQHIEIPRYMPFKDVLMGFAEQGVEIVNISGQKRIQLDILLKNDEKNPAVGQKGCNALYETPVPADKENKFLALEVEVEHLHTALRHLKAQNANIAYIHDF